MKLELKLTNDWLEATWYTEVDEVRTQVHCESFSGHVEHIAMLRAKALEYGTELDEVLIAECIASFKMPTAEEIALELLRTKVAEARAYLASTDFKMTSDYDEDVTEIKTKRAEARDFIRANDVPNP